VVSKLLTVCSIDRLQRKIFKWKKNDKILRSVFDFVVFYSVNSSDGAAEWFIAKGYARLFWEGFG
jgi:hypothetical protein